MASLADVRRRTSGIVRNAKAYKIPKDLLGTDLCHFIEHACGLREDAPPTASAHDDQAEHLAAVDEKINDLVTLIENIDTDYEPCPSYSGYVEDAPVDELSPNTKFAYDLRSPKGKRNYEQGILDGIKISKARQLVEKERDVNVNCRSKTPVASSSDTRQNAKRPRRRLEFAAGTIGVVNNVAITAERNTSDEQCLRCGQDSPPSRKGGLMINWIDCDSCKNWFHLLCLKMKKKDVPAKWLCNNCES